MDRLFGDFTTTRVRLVGEPSPLTFPVDIAETDSDVTVKATLPGTKPEDVEITVSEGVLTIRGESRHEETAEKENYYRREIRYGAFSRSLPLPPTWTRSRPKRSSQTASCRSGCPRRMTPAPRPSRSRPRVSWPALPPNTATQQTAVSAVRICPPAPPIRIPLFRPPSTGGYIEYSVRFEGLP